MKTDFLKGLGITDQTVIDQIMAENGRDINNARGNTEQLNSQITGLQEQLTERDNQLKELKKSVKDNEQLTAKITELETANQTAATDYQNKLIAIQTDHAVENGIRDAKAKNIKAVKALLDMSKITYAEDKISGLDEQLDALQKNEETSFLFTAETTVPPAPAGTTVYNPPANGTGNGTPPTSGSWAEAVAKALGGNK